MATHEMTIFASAQPESQISDSTRYELQQQILLEIQIEAEVLHSTDVGKSDPYCVVNEVRKDMLGFSVIGRTEKISNADTVAFRLPIYVPYLFEEDQIIQFSIYDFDLVGGNDLIGVSAVQACKLAETKFMKLDLRKKQRKTAILSLHIDIIPPLPPESYSLTFNAFLPRKLFNPNTYLVIEKIRSDEKRIEVYRSGKQKHKSSPVWTIRNIEGKFLHTNKGSKLEFSVYSTSTFGKDKLIGSIEAAFDEICCKSQSDTKQQGFNGSLMSKVMVRSPSMLGYDADTETRRRSSTECRLEEKGTMEINSLKVDKATPEYSNYLSSNEIELKLYVAIDFTASNGNPNELSSLHTVTGSGNKYIEVLRGSLPGLLKYADNHIAAYGFGAKLDERCETSHCFPLNDNEQNPDVLGLEDLLETYKSKLREITLSGPTVFSKVIKTVALNVKRETEKKTGKNKYNILLILTDGVICDREATIDSIVYASYLPISIVIVGLGSADFTDMRRLDGDLQPLANGKKQKSIRDIVQFVSLESIERNRSVVKRYEKEELFMTKAINREIPEHVIEYFGDLEKKIEKILKAPYNNFQWWRL